MIGISSIMGVLGAVAEPIKSIVTGWQTRKTVELESDVAIVKAKTEANIEKIRTGQVADIAWEQTSIQNSSWKDEYLTIIITLPLILCFIPGLVEYVVLGFAALKNCPQWYQYAVGVVISSAFGVKKFSDFMKLKKGS